jgi:hypothetical protein
MGAGRKACAGMGTGREVELNADASPETWFPTAGVRAFHIGHADRNLEGREATTIVFGL